MVSLRAAHEAVSAKRSSPPTTCSLGRRDAPDTVLAGAGALELERELDERFGEVLDLLWSLRLALGALPQDRAVHVCRKAPRQRCPSSS